VARAVTSLVRLLEAAAEHQVRGAALAAQQQHERAASEQPGAARSPATASPPQALSSLLAEALLASGAAAHWVQVADTTPLRLRQALFLVMLAWHHLGGLGTPISKHRQWWGQAAGALAPASFKALLPQLLLGPVGSGYRRFMSMAVQMVMVDLSLGSAAGAKCAALLLGSPELRRALAQRLRSQTLRDLDLSCLLVALACAMETASRGGGPGAELALLMGDAGVGDAAAICMARECEGGRLVGGRLAVALPASWLGPAGASARRALPAWSPAGAG
jgi:hypothetical protein